MKTIELKPIRERPEYWERLAAYIVKHLKAEIYGPLMKEIGHGAEDVLKNSQDDLLRAITSGRIRYSKGRFEGRFSAQLSKELKALGAVWGQGTWKLPGSELPNQVRVALSMAEARSSEMAKRVDSKLSKLSPEAIADKMELEGLFVKTLAKVNGDFNETMKVLEVKAQLTEQQTKFISDTYTENMKLYIRTWTQDEIVKLRKSIQQHSFAGRRYGDMVKVIQESYGTSQSKAKFLARQETSLLMTSFKETRYKDAGVNEYKWRTVVGAPNHPVRPYHKALDGKIYNWNNPPIVDAEGHRKHPGQDFNCRCTAIPIVRF